MPQVKRTITLKQRGDQYKVVKLQNSTEYSVNQRLTEDEVKQLIRSKWTVNIT